MSSVRAPSGRFGRRTVYTIHRPATSLESHPKEDSRGPVRMLWGDMKLTVFCGEFTRVLYGLNCAPWRMQ